MYSSLLIYPVFLFIYQKYLLYYMNSLQFLSGFTIGHIIKKSLDDTRSNMDDVREYLIDYYGHLWDLFHDNDEFINGFEISMGSYNFPALKGNIGSWFSSLVYSEYIISVGRYS